MKPSKAHIDNVRDGRTNAQIAEALSSVLRKPIPLAVFENWLFDRKLAVRGLDGAWQGPFIDVIGNEQLPLEIRHGLASLFQHVNKPRSTVLGVDQPDYGVQANQLIGGLVLLNVITQELHDEFDLLGGGHLYATGVTEQEVADAIAEYDAEEATREAREALIESYEAAIGANVDLHTMTMAEIVAGLRAAADALEAG